MTRKRSIEAGLSVLQTRWPDIRNDCNEEPIFVLSAGWRSGSTMLQRLIMPHCFVWGEPFGHSYLIDSLADHLRCFTVAWPRPNFFHNGDDAETLSRRFIANLYPSIQDLLESQQTFFMKLFADPARRNGALRWGLKEVRLGMGHALYFKWLFPRAKFLFLIRNPYDAWRSYAARAARGTRWFNRWPDKPLTVHSFAEHWRSLASEFVRDHLRVNGFVIRYEDLILGDYTGTEQYLGFPLSVQAARTNPSDGGPPPLAGLLPSDRLVLRDVLGSLAHSLDYPCPTAAIPAGPQSFGVVSPNKKRDNPALPRVAKSLSVNMGSHFKKTSKCIVMITVGSRRKLDRPHVLNDLEGHGYTVCFIHRFSSIDRTRSLFATRALRARFEELMWIDGDLNFDLKAVEVLRSYGLPMTCGIYPRRRFRTSACIFPEGSRVIGDDGGGTLREVTYAGAGFLHTRHEVYEAVQDRFRLPTCNERPGLSTVPFFQPAIVSSDQGYRYLPDDYSFCHRVRECGYRIMADTSLKLKVYCGFGFESRD